MHALCILNPLSAEGLSLRRWPDVERALHDHGATFDLLAPSEGDLREHVKRHLREHDVSSYGVIAGIGGDGTHAAIINGLMGLAAERPDLRLPPYAFVPLGTGNDIAKSFGLTARDDLLVDDIRLAISTALHGADYRLDLGILGGHYFADAFTLGLDSAILRDRNVRKRWLQRVPIVGRVIRGALLYTLCTGIGLIRQRPIAVRITVDGREWYEGHMLNLVVNNTQIYAGEFYFFRQSYANDGLLDVFLFTGHTDYLRSYLFAIRHHPEKIREFSERLNRVSTHVQGRDIRIRLEHPEGAQMDGEELPARNEFLITVAPGALAIKTPAEPM